MGQEGSSSKAEQSMKRKGKGSFRQALRRQKSETVKTRIRRTSPRAKKANKFRRVPQQLFSSSAITGGEMGGYAEHVFRSRRDLSMFIYLERYCVLCRYHHIAVFCTIFNTCCCRVFVSACFVLRCWACRRSLSSCNANCTTAIVSADFMYLAYLVRFSRAGIDYNYYTSFYIR